MEWLEPWWSTEDFDESFHETFRKQLELEVSLGHAMYQIPARLIARGNGDDALFQILDGSERVAVVHLTWSKSQEHLPWPITSIYASIEEFIKEVMLLENKDWVDE